MIGVAAVYFPLAYDVFIVVHVSIGQDVESVMDILGQLEKAHVDVNVLKVTHIGKTVHKATKVADAVAAAAAEKLVQKWKQVAAVTRSESGGAVTQAPSTESAASAVAVSPSAATPSAALQDLSLLTPQAAAASPSSSPKAVPVAAAAVAAVVVSPSAAAGAATGAGNTPAVGKTTDAMRNKVQEVPIVCVCMLIC